MSVYWTILELMVGLLYTYLSAGTDDYLLSSTNLIQSTTPRNYKYFSKNNLHLDYNTIMITT